MAKLLGEVDLFGSFASIFDEDEYYGGASKVKAWSTVEYLAWVAKAIRESGWVSRGAVFQGKAQGPATADVAQTLWETYERQLRRGH